MQAILTAVPYPVVGPVFVRRWGPLCLDHPEIGNVPTDDNRESATAFALALACDHPDHYVPGTKAEWRTVDPITGEQHLFAADGTNLSVEAGAPELPPCPPDHVINAVIVKAMQEHPQQVGKRAHWPWADMTPVVTGAEVYAEPNRWGDVWWVEVQYSSRGYRAAYGVNRDNVPQCYAD